MGLYLLAARVTFFVLGAVGYANLAILPKLSQTEQGTYAYSMPTVVMQAEFMKLLLSLGFLSRELGSALAAVRQVAQTRPLVWIQFCVPAVLYAMNNNMDIINSMFMDPATASVLAQFKILTTALAWRIVFKQELGPRKWGALCLLVVGGMAAGWPQANGAEKKTMYIEPTGVLCMTFYNIVSAAAGVYVEWLYKGPGAGDSMHVCNIRLYLVGSLVCLVGHLYNKGGDMALWKGYNVWAWLLVCNFAFMGLVVAAIIKFFNSIVKLIINAASMYATALLTVVIWGRLPSWVFMSSLLIVTTAIAVYNGDQLFSPQVRSKITLLLGGKGATTCMCLLAVVALGCLAYNFEAVKLTDASSVKMGLTQGQQAANLRAGATGAPGR